MAGSSLIVGVGASAGGLEALELLFRDMPPDCGMSFVVQQHLSPDFESRMEELLGRETSLRVRTVQDGILVEPGTIYLAPPKKEMALSDGKLQLIDRVAGPSLPIDHFFRSLASEAGANAVGIVLSGTGSDGTRGVRDIHQAGGLVIVQTPESARFDGMPRSAMATGLTDLVLEPTAIAGALAAYAEHGVASIAAEQVPVPEAGVAEILRLLRSAYGIDFSYYKPTTVMRRIERRLQMTSFADVDEYADTLRGDAGELDLLYHDLLIGVTRFFRDPAAFAALDAALPALLEARGDEDLRVWVPGCATGEEAYTIAMLIAERFPMRTPVPLKIFATDVHRSSLEVASAGRYPLEAVAGLEPSLRERFFRPDGERHVRIDKDLRQTIVFAAHNVISDAPFTRLDVISCRNLLIYFQPPAQQKVLSLFHLALRTGGVMLMGPSETPGPIEDEFEPLSKPWRLYRKRRDVRLIADGRMPLVPAQLTGPRMPVAVPRPPPLRDARLIAIYDALLARHLRAGLLIDEDHQLVHSFGEGARLLQIRPGRMSSNVLDLLDPELKNAVSGALQRVRRDRKALRYTGLRVTVGDEARQLDLSVEPLVISPGEPPQFLVQLDDAHEPVAPPDEAPDTVDAERVSRDYIGQLENELRFTKENLQATVEELETANEELQATNEELVASNEELQSTNEELHSVNEELQTVNSEYQRKIDQLTELTDDMDNLLQSIDVGVLFLDEDLRIREFTSAMASTFHLIRGDRGRPFGDFAHHLLHPTLLADIERVVRGGVGENHEVDDHSGNLRLLRILPYRAKTRTAGVVLTMIDIGTLRRAEANVRRLSAIVEHAADAIFREDYAGTITDWNHAATTLFGWSAEEITGRPAATLVAPDQHQELIDVHGRVRSGESLDDHETVRLHRSGRRMDVDLTVSPVRDERDAIVGSSTIARDISRRKRAEEIARQAVEQRERFLATLSHELRNPMMAMLTAAETVSGADLTPRGKKAVDVIRRQVHHTAHLLEDLLDISRMLHGRLPISTAPMDLREIVDDVLDEVGPRAGDAHVELDLRIPESPLVLRGDKTRLRQLLANLLGNAIKYSPGDARVHLTLARDGDQIVIEVVDHGIGIDASDCARLFDPFYQGRGGAIGGGMGLGLALVKAIAIAHGGEVDCHSDGPGEGATFRVGLPRLADQRLATPVAQPARPRPQLGVVRRVILLVEDQEDNRELLGEALGEAGFEVAAAGTLREALDTLDRVRPNAAIVDISLPDGSGHAVAQRIRAMPDGHAIRIIAVTGHGRQSDRDAILAAGFDHHLVKPVSVDTLVHAIGT